MASDWKNIIQQQLAGMQNNPGMQNSSGMNAISVMPQQQQQRQLRVGNNPNPKFPRARNWWEGVKEGGGNFLWGKQGGAEQVQNFTPQQQGIMQLLQMLGLQGLQDPSAGFEPIENQARTQFSQQTVPSIAERFTSMGNNALSSPSFAAQLGQAGAGLEGDLASQRAQFGQQNIQQLLQMLQMGLQPQFENIYRPREAGAAENLGKAALGNIGGLWDMRQKANALKGLTFQG